jgi:hypothetical protein
MFYRDSTIKFGNEKGFSESYYILCPVCWNSSIKITCWEDGTCIEEGCDVCDRIQRTMNG